MYKVTDMVGNVLAKFSTIGRARFYAAQNKPCQLVNKQGKVIAQY